jgi:hypothetical protein
VELGRPRGLGKRPTGLAQPVGSVTQIKMRDRLGLTTGWLGEGVERQRTPRDRTGLESRLTPLL